MMKTFLVAIASVVVFSLSGIAVAQTGDNEVDYAASLATLQNRMKTAMEVLGPGVGQLRLDAKQWAEGGLDLTPLRKLAFDQNDGKPIVIEVPVHSSNRDSVRYANKQLDQMGFDFIRYEPKEDPSAPELKDPLPTQREAWEKWRLTRTFIAPFVGFAVPLAQVSVGGGGFDSLLSEAVLPTLAVAVVVAGLEAQFSLFSGWWNDHFWSKDAPLRITIPAVRLNSAIGRIAGALLDVMARPLNLLFDRTINPALSAVGANVGHLLSYVVNWGYGLILFMTAWTAERMLGLSDRSFDILQMVSDSWILTNAFYLAFGLFQVALGKMSRQGEISEGLRFTLETLGVFWNNFWRAVTVVPGLQFLGLGMQLSWGAIMTAPTLYHLASVGRNNNRIREKFAVNAERAQSGAPHLPDAAACQMLLARGSTAKPWFTRTSTWKDTVSHMASSLRQLVVPR